MKKLISILTVLLIAAPAFAAVTIECSQSGETEVTVTYNATAEGKLVRAFALDITVTGANIVDVNADPLGFGDGNMDYYIYPGSIDINDATGVIDYYGSAVADPCAYPYVPYGTLGADPNGATVEMGSLYVGAPNAPDATGTLMIVTVDSNECCVAIAENPNRGGVVMEDGSTPGIVSDGICLPAGCPCLGDITGTALSPPFDPDQATVNVYDLQALATYMYNNHYPTFTLPTPIPDEFLCADVTETSITPISGPSGVVNVYDLQAIATYLYVNFYPTFTGPCMTVP